MKNLFCHSSYNKKHFQASKVVQIKLISIMGVINYNSIIFATNH